MQSATNDTVKGYEEIDLLKATVLDVRKNTDEYHQTWYNEATALGDLVGSSPSMPRICKRQTTRDNQSANSPFTYYRIALTSQLLDHLINELSVRFDKSGLNLVKGFIVIPALLHERIVRRGRAFWNSGFLQFVEPYKEDLPDFDCLRSEMDIWEMYWTQKFVGKLPDRISDTLKETVSMKTTFPDIFCAMCILGTIPITTCECERSISSLRRLKSYLRSTMSQNRLNRLAALHIHRDIRINVDAIIDKFARMHPQRLEMISILCTDA